MGIFENFNRGDRLSAAWTRDVVEELRRLGKIKGTGGITVSSSPAGIVIRGSETEGTPFVYAKAKVEEGDYPTLLEWSEATGFPEKQTEWWFQMGSSDATGTDENPVDPTDDWNAEEPARYVKAYNDNRYHYVPQNAMCVLSKIKGTWRFWYAMQPIIEGVVTDSPDLNVEYLNITTQVFGGGKVRVYTGESQNYYMNGDIVRASLVSPSVNDIRYVIVSTNTCPHSPPEEEEEGGE